MNPQIQQFVDILRAETSAAVEIDAPASDLGEWWIDLEIDGLRTNVSWQASRGFGIYAAEGAYGARPQELFREPAEAGARVLQLAAQWRKTRKVTAMRLRDLRHLVGETQLHVADALDTDQARVSRIENGADIKLSALANYLEAIGGTLEIKAHFPTFEVPIAPIDSFQTKSRRKQDA